MDIFNIITRLDRSFRKSKSTILSDTEWDIIRKELFKNKKADSTAQNNKSREILPIRDWDRSSNGIPYWIHDATDKINEIITRINKNDVAKT
jgi:hypothetical protein